MVVFAKRRASRSRPARIASVLVGGRPARQCRQNERRIELLAAVARTISTRPNWNELDALVWPAGFFKSPDWMADLAPYERRLGLDGSDFGEACAVSARKLAYRSPGCLVVVGIDGRRPSRGWYGGDQLVAAFSPHQCVGAARKVFPSDADTNGWGRAAYIVNGDDADDGDRYVKLANGQVACLAVCYDAFILSELAVGPSDKQRGLRYQLEDGGGWRELDAPAQREIIDRFGWRLRNVRPDVALVAIHGFQGAGREIYWQRHGLASASAALDGGFCVGAAHFARSLPGVAQSFLAARGVGGEHIAAGPHRRAEALQPVDQFVVPGRRWHPPALVRLFEDL